MILCNGTPVTIRPLCVEDAPELQDLVARLSPESRYLRFFSARCTLLPEEALQMASIDYHTHMGYAAVVPEGRVIGTACYSTRPALAATADFAIMVEDPYQGLGLGTHLLLMLAAYARAEGLERLCALVNAENTRMLHCVERTGLPFNKHWQSGAWEVSLDVSGAGDAVGAAPRGRPDARQP